MVMSLPAGTYGSTEGIRPRKWGTGGKAPVSTRCAKVLTEAVPRRSLVLSIAGKNISHSPVRQDGI